MTSKQYFEEVASQWDRLRASFYSEAVRDRALAVVQVQPGQVAADIGAGTGFITEGLLQQGLRVVAVDQSEAMLAQMRQKFGDNAPTDYRVGEAEHLPIPSATVDYVFANMYLHHVESPPQAIGEMARILKPGGTLVITDLDEHSFEFLAREHHDRWLGFQREAVERWLVAAGLGDVGTDCVGEDCCTQSSTGEEEASVSIFVAWGHQRRATAAVLERAIE